MKIDFDKIYPSNNYGYFKIIEDIGYDENHRYWVKIKFIETGFEKVVRYDIAMAGRVKDDLYGIDFYKIFISNSGLEYKILKYIGRDKESKRLVLIRFLVSGTEKVVQFRAAKNGSVYDEYAYINFDKIYWSNQYGPFKIIRRIGSINGHIRVIIKFLNTGYEKDVQIENVKTGQVKDDTAKCKQYISINNIGKDEYDNRLIIHLKSIWKSMISRCTNQNNPSYINYGAVGVKVCNEWMDFNNFLNDIPSIFQYDKFYYNPYLYELDKDYFQLNLPKNQRIYSKNTCVFLLYLDNVNLSVIEYNKNNKLSSKYYGVTKKNNKFVAQIMINNTAIKLGIFDNEIAAANAYNKACLYYHNFELIPLLNNVPIMSTEEIVSHNINLKMVCKVVKDA